MKPNLLLAGAVSVVACSPTPSSTEHSGRPDSGIATSTQTGFRPVASIQLQHDEFSIVVKLPVPAKRDGRVLLAGLHLLYPTVLPTIPREEFQRQLNEVRVPSLVSYADAITGEQLPTIDGTEKHFGIPDPPNRLLGHYDDPTWLPEDRRDQLRARILAGLDVLLPFFADENRPWTEAANKAAEEVRDFFPLAAEPGLWPYYRAEGREFFAWLEKNAPPAKAPLPWAENK